MKTINTTETPQSVNDLLTMAKVTDLLLQAIDGTQYVLMNVTDSTSFFVGDSDEIEDEMEAERLNEAMMKFLDERAERANAGNGVSLADVRRQLGL